MATSVKATQVVVPALDHDAMMASRFQSKVSPEGRLERKIVFCLITHLIERGFFVDGVYDGEEMVKCSDAKSAMEVIFNLDEASLRMRKVGHGQHGVLLVMGNGCDILSDWSFSDGDADGFNAAMDAFDSDAIEVA